MIPGTNHCSVEPSPTSDSSGANSARNTSGWTIAKSTEAGSRSIGRSSRIMTLPMSASGPGARTSS